MLIEEVNNYTKKIILLLDCIEIEVQISLKAVLILNKI